MPIRNEIPVTVDTTWHPMSPFSPPTDAAGGELRPWLTARERRDDASLRVRRAHLRGRDAHVPDARDAQPVDDRPTRDASLLQNGDARPGRDDALPGDARELHALPSISSGARVLSPAIPFASSMLVLFVRVTVLSIEDEFATNPSSARLIQWFPWRF